MKRIFSLLTVLSAFFLSAISFAAPTAGKDYLVLKRPFPTQSKGAEVVEFFSYACPHCHHMEPALNAWRKRKAAGVTFRREHIIWDRSTRLYAQVFYTLKALGAEDKLANAGFEAVQKQNIELRRLDAAKKWVATQKINPQRFAEAYDSFGVQSALSATEQWVKDYNLDSTPILIVNGKYLTSPSLAGSMEKTFEVVEALLAQRR